MVITISSLQFCLHLSLQSFHSFFQIRLKDAEFDSGYTVNSVLPKAVSPKKSITMPMRPPSWSFPFHELPNHFPAQVIIYKTQQESTKLQKFHIQKTCNDQKFLRNGSYCHTSLHGNTLFQWGHWSSTHLKIMYFLLKMEIFQYHISFPGVCTLFFTKTSHINTSSPTHPFPPQPWRPHPQWPFSRFPHGVLPPTWLQHSPVLQRRPAKRISCEHPASPKRGKGPSIICYVASLSPQKEMKWIIFQIIHFQIPIMRIAYEDSSRWWLNPSEPCL